MTQITKLYGRLLANPGAALSFRDFELLLRAFGFTLLRTKGSHKCYGHPQYPGLLVVQPNGNEAKRYQVRAFLDIVEEFGLTLEA